MKNWISLFLFTVVVRDIGSKCIDTVDKGHNMTTVCAEVYRYSLKGFPVCESQEPKDCDYMYEIAADLNDAEAKGVSTK